MSGTRLMIRCDEDIAEDFRELAEQEGRKQGKLLEILIEEYKKSKEEK